MKRTAVIIATLGLATAILIGINLVNGQLEPLIAPEPVPIQGTHLDVNNSTLILHVPLVDPNGVAASGGAINVRIDKSDLDGLTAQQKQNLRAVVVKLLQLKGFIP